MRSLLNQSETRRLNAIEIMYQEKDWITLAELSKRLDCSVRILKDDIAHFKSTFDHLTIEGSNKGVRLAIAPNTGLKAIYQYFLKNSTAYQLLEMIFFNNHITAIELVDLLQVSSSTLYRLIDQINEVFQEEDFRIGTNPCRILGSEQYIRHFFYNFFYEKYSYFEWPYHSINEEGLNTLLHAVSSRTTKAVDLADYNILKTIIAVNFIRFNQEYYVNTEDIKKNLENVFPDFEMAHKDIQTFEERTQTQMNNHLMKQLFTPYLQVEFAPSYDRLVHETKENQPIKQGIQFLEEALNDLANKHQLPLKNIEDILLNVHNGLHLKFYDPRSGYILHNHNQDFAQQIQKYFPIFYEDLYEEIVNYSKIANKPIAENTVYFLIYIIFSKWAELLPALRRQLEKITILVVSDRSTSHAEMIKYALEYEFTEQIAVEVCYGIELDQEALSKTKHNIIVANFPLPVLEETYTIYVDNLPTYYDLMKIKDAIDKIILDKYSK